MARRRRTAVEGISEQGPSDESPETVGLVLDKNLGTPVLLVTTATTLTAWDMFVDVDATAAPVTITLPAANIASVALNNQGAVYRIIKSDASANAVTVARAGADTINGAASVNTTTRYTGFDLHCVDAATWRALAVG